MFAIKHIINRDDDVRKQNLKKKRCAIVQINTNQWYENVIV